LTAWQRRTRWALGAFAIAFAVIVVFAFKRNAPPQDAGPVEPVDPGAVIATTGGRIQRFKSSREDVSVEYDKQLSYADGSARMIGVRIVSAGREGGQSFTVTGNEGRLGENESTLMLEGEVRLEATDGFVARTDAASYASADGLVRAAGPVDFSRARLRGSGVGMTYDSNRGALTILDQAVIHFDADDQGAGGFDITSGAATFSRRDHRVSFERSMRLERAGRVMEADNGVAMLTADEKQLEAIELHGGSSITTADPTPGGVRALTGESIDLKYRPDGVTLEHALLSGTSAIELAGQPDASGRKIEADTIDVTLAPDGATPTSLLAHQNVALTLPAEKGAPARTIKSQDLDARGAEGKGLTAAHFSGSVDYREVGVGAGRAAKSRALDLVMKPGMTEIDQATFAGAARFEEGGMRATAASARYTVGRGTLALSGSETSFPMPRVVNEQITVNAKLIDLTLAGPKMTARGSVQSEMQPSAAKAQKDATKLPSMLKQDQAVNVTADSLDYDGPASKAVYTGSAQLWQGDTSVKGASIVIDDSTGDLTASGPATTTTVLERLDKDKKTERVRSVGSAADFVYEEKLRRATYTGDAHLSGPQGDMRAQKIELYLKASGNELDRAEAYDETNAMTLREQSRTTTGGRMTYTTDDDRYVVTGIPVKIIDECGRETTGRTLTFHRATDSIVVDGNGFRTRTKGGSGCQ
jgi:lipopolysaccharide export system protein LptA